MKFRIQIYARRNGAIGIKCNYAETVEASDEEAAVLKLYEKYEHINVVTCHVIEEGP